MTVLLVLLLMKNLLVVFMTYLKTISVPQKNMHLMSLNLASGNRSVAKLDNVLFVCRKTSYMPGKV